MRTSTLLATLALSATAFAQSPLTTTFASNNGQAGNMFDLVATNPQGVTINSFDVNVDPGTWDLRVYALPAGQGFLPEAQNPAAWRVVGEFPGIVSAGTNVPTPLPMLCETIFIPAGGTQAFYVTVTNGTGINYTTGTGFPAGTVYASNSDLDFLAGSGNSFPFGSVFGPPSSSRVFNGNIYYDVGNTAVAACPITPEKELYGSGCYDVASASVYELFAHPDLDLEGKTLSVVNNGNGYDVTVGAGALAPVGATAVQVTLGDDAQVDTADPAIGGTLGLVIGSNGWLALGGGNSNGFVPNVGTMLDNPSTAIYAWTDLQPNAAVSGPVWYEENGTAATVTFDGVPAWGTSNLNEIQFTYDSATGNFSVTFGATSAAAGGPEDWLVGFTPGGASLDPGATDLSGLAEFDVAETEAFYEEFTPTSIDLSGRAVNAVNNGGVYTVSTGPANIVAPGATAVQVTLGDDTQVDTADPAIGGTLGLFIGSNGWLALGAGNSNGFVPSVSTFLSNPSPAIYAWTDLQPNAAGSGPVFYEENGTVATVTYDGVYGWGTTDPNTIQITLDTATGDFSIAFGVLSGNNPEDWLIGYSFGGGVADPGPSDLSGTTVSLGASDTFALAVDSNLAQIGLNWDLTADNVDASSPFAVFAFGDMRIDPGVGLGPIGGFGCSVYMNANLGFFTSTVSMGSSTFTVPVPASPAVLSAEVFAQAAGATPLNALGFATSNGLRVKVGN